MHGRVHSSDEITSRQRLLAACADHRRIVLTTAGVAPPGCPAEKFRAIGQWVKDVPVRMSNDE